MSTSEAPRRIGLSMIVRNERAVIIRCLESVRALIDYAVIEDTGSTDGTQQLIADWLAEAGIPGFVIAEPWQNFAYNRSHALAELRKLASIDYALIIDADDVLVMEAGFDPTAFKQRLCHDVYSLEIRSGEHRFHRPQICRSSRPFRFRAVIHEYLEAPEGDVSYALADGCYIDIKAGGARSRNPHKYADDAALLEAVLSTETDPFLIARYTFYLAQSYRDCGRHETALVNYLKRAGMGFWQEEIFVSLYEAAKIKELLALPAAEVITAYLEAANTLPSRAEALHGLSRFCRRLGRNEEGYAYARRGIAVPCPATGLFVANWIYEYGLLDELAVNAYWAGCFAESLDACLTLLSTTTLPLSERDRVAANARFAAAKLPRPPSLARFGRADPPDQNKMPAARPLRSCLRGTPRVLVAILAKQKEKLLPLYLDCIEALDYPKSAIALYIRTNNNTDGTSLVLRDWVGRCGRQYASVEFDSTDVGEPVERFGVHEWNALRFRVLGRIRRVSMQRALERDCDFYFTADVDNFIRPCTLKELVALHLPIVSPLLRSIQPGSFYSNYHADIDDSGYYRECDQYHWILNGQVRGVLEVPVVHCTYLIRSDILPELTYDDGSERHEYVILSDSARRARIPQYIDNRQVYGYLTLGGSDGHEMPDGGAATSWSD